MDRRAVITEYIKNEIIRNNNIQLNEDEDLLSSGVLDSLGILQLVTYLEKTLDIRIPDEDVVYENFQSINTMVEYMKGY